MKKLTSILLIISLLVTTGCDNFLDITPTGRVIPETAQDYRELMTEAYYLMPSSRGLTAFISDEIDMTSKNLDSYDKDSFLDLWLWNNVNPSGATTYFDWAQYYKMIFIANTVIENEKSITNGTEAEINQIVGEAYMMRAYNHFILVNLYALPYNSETATSSTGIPLKLNSSMDEVLKPSSIAEVYASVLSDIDNAEKKLNVETWETGLNYRFNTLSVDALRSRVYLYMGQWEDCYNASERVLSKKNELVDLVSGRTLPNAYNSSESIVALEMNMTSTYNNVDKLVPQTLYSLYLPSGQDQRARKFYKTEVGGYSLIKGGSSEYRCSFRVGEIYLNAAEAALKNHHPEICKTLLLKLLEKRYQTAAYTQAEIDINAMDDDALLDEVYLQRQLELSYEGHRWFDIRRMEKEKRPVLTREYEGQTYRIEDNYPELTIKIPDEAKEANPYL
ncbi:RagB/SusD family nutrient uptake outer membrane protein [Coprobacter secundus]|uniref:Membrane protein n=1 Tax=Coprobacter secundus subsp. similis TaxID=2751153 RepID=A0A7G1HX08_9BACT|nr:RagB/SusD family nutrient uptake outer membrane protein [Coprobacter secundus]BCI62728.1 membrane protein [Coprobacter secundus subsp. similis]